MNFYYLIHLHNHYPDPDMNISSILEAPLYPLPVTLLPRVC